MLSTTTAPPGSGPLRPIAKKFVVEEVLSTLRKAILSGAFAAEDHLVESRLAVQLGVSRAPVREAMFQLEREGLLAFDSQGAAIVRQLTSVDMEEIYTLRIALEVMAVRLACQRLTALHWEALRANIRQTEAEKSLLNLTLLDMAFHDILVEAAGNSRLQAAWQNLRPQLELWLARLHIRHQTTTKQTRAETARAHRGLLEELALKDPDRAEHRMKQHLDGWRTYLDGLPL